MTENVGLNLFVKGCDLNKLFEILSKEGYSSNHLVRFEVVGEYRTVKDWIYNVKVISKNPDFIENIITVMKKES